MSHYESFVIRIWIDREEKATRGQITDVRTRAASNFRDWDKMLDFIVDNVGELDGEDKKPRRNGARVR